jgi:hypothetical protein
MNPTRILCTSALVLAPFALVGCGKKSTPSATSTAAPAATAAKQPETAQGVPASALSPAAKASLEQVLAAYERLRNELSRDDIATSGASAEALENAAKSAIASAPEKLRAHVERLASRAEQLKQMPKQDAAAVRRAFGQISEAIVSVLAAEPSLREGRHVFECPMAQGYKKWVQTSDRVSNPYMGSAMPECGSPSKWEG